MRKPINQWINQETGRWLRENRLRCGYTLKQTSALLGITYQQVQKYEMGTNRLSVQRLMAFCETLDVWPESLLLNLRHGHHVDRYGYMGKQAAGIARRIRDDDLLRLWLALGERIAQPTAAPSPDERGPTSGACHAGR